MKTDIIYLDMDGVCCDFVGAAAKLFDKDAKTARSWNFMEDAWGMTPKRFWGGIDMAGPSFWSDMPELPGFRDLYLGLCKLAPVVFLTSPSQDPNCAHGKTTWLQRRFSAKFRDYIICPAEHKCQLSRPGAVLIDDNEKNCAQWGVAGGKAYLYPAPWNRCSFDYDQSGGEPAEPFLRGLTFVINFDNNNPERKLTPAQSVIR